MRGFGAVQAASRYEAQMDKLAAALGMDPVELRLRNAMEPGAPLPTGQVDRTARRRSPSCSSACAAMPLPPTDRRRRDLRELPGGVANTTHGEGVRRGVGYAVGFKNIGFSEGFDDYSTARVRLSIVGGEPLVEVHTAAAEVGQGLVTVQAQIARTELGVEQRVGAHRRHPRRLGRLDVGVAPDVRDRRRGQGRLRGGARASSRRARPPSDARRASSSPTATVATSPTCSATTDRGDRRVAPPRDLPARPANGQGDAHVQFAFAAHRAVVDVDVELGPGAGRGARRPRRTSAGR